MIELAADKPKKEPTFPLPLRPYHPFRTQPRGKPLGPEGPKEHMWRRFSNLIHEARAVSIHMRKSVDLARLNCTLDDPATADYVAQVLNSLWLGIHNAHLALLYLPEFSDADPAVRDGVLACCSEVGGKKS